MTKIPASYGETTLEEMTNDKLNLATARLLGLDVTGEAPPRVRGEEGDVIYSPITRLDQASALIPRFGLNLRCLSMSRPGGRNEWGAWMGTEPVDDAGMTVAETPEKALVLALLSIL
jgi:hypothetical protein